MPLRATLNPITRNIGKLILGTGVGQLIALIAAPFIAQQFGPQSFGEQAAVLSIAGPMVTLTSMAFPIAIVIARTDIEAAALSRLAFLGTLVFSPLATAFLIINDKWLLNWLGLEQIGNYVTLIPIIAILTTMNMSAGYVMTRVGAFNISAWASIFAAILGNSSKLLLGFVWPSTFSLIVGNAVSYLVAPLLAFRLQRRMNYRKIQLSSEQLRKIANDFRDFALLRAPQNFLAAVSQSIPIMGLTAGFGAKSAGYYAIAIALAGAPISLIGNAVQTVLYPRLTEAGRSGADANSLLMRSTIWLTVLGIPFFALILAFGPWIFTMLLGPEWREAGVYSALLVPWMWLGLANRPAVSLIPVLGLQSGLLLYEIVGTAAKLGAIVIGYHVFESARWTIGLFSGVGAVSYFLLIAWVAWSSRKADQRCTDEKTS